MQTVTPFLWFNNNAEEAMKFYASVFKNVTIHWFNGMTGEFEINGQRLMVLNGGPHFKFTEAISLFVEVETQKEVDELWNKLTSNGGQESRCGWLKDKYGLSWQIIPSALGRLLNDPDKAKAQRVMQAMLQMSKIEISKLQEAYHESGVA
jgi:predicted 3-demethylubiquinone-9 3-methyltransferase (glyoxalase superfamily)